MLCDGVDIDILVVHHRCSFCLLVCLCVREALFRDNSVIVSLCFRDISTTLVLTFISWFQTGTASISFHCTCRKSISVKSINKVIYIYN